VKSSAVLLSAAFLASCASGGASSTSAETGATVHPLMGIVGQNIVIAPLQALRIPAEVGWTGLPAARTLLANLDSVITDSLKSRVGNAGWVYAADVVKSAAANPTYATDPRAFAVNPLRASSLKISDRLPEPVASQLRTMIALHDARLVLIPLDLTVDRTAAGEGHPVVHLVLVDPRSSIVRWIGQIAGPDSPAFTSALSASIAARFADLFAER
jgi:hypothetical protein